MSDIRADYVRKFCEAVKGSMKDLGWSKEKALKVLGAAEITVEDLVHIGESEIESWMRKAEHCGWSAE